MGGGVTEDLECQDKELDLVQDKAEALKDFKYESNTSDLFEALCKLRHRNPSRHSTRQWRGEREVTSFTSSPQPSSLIEKVPPTGQFARPWGRSSRGDLVIKGRAQILCC